MKEHFKLLGVQVRDRVTGFVGVVTSISFDLFGCVQAIVTPGAAGEKLESSHWFDTKRLIALNDVPVMELPTFETVPGGQDLPSQERHGA